MKNLILAIFMVGTVQAKSELKIHTLTVSEIQEREALIKKAYNESSIMKQVEYDTCVKEEGKDANCENDVFGDLYN